MNLRESAQLLKDILGLSYEPVAVKFLEDVVVLDGFELPSKRRYCQALMGARQGKKCLITGDNLSCPAAAAAFGFSPLPPKLVSGEMPAKMGIFGNSKAVQNTLNSMTRLDMGRYKMIALCPLKEAPFEPDVVVIESAPEHLMWVALAQVFEEGGRLEFTTAIVQATCVDSTIIPFVTQRLNASLGCYGCREATNMTENECILGFPIKLLEPIVNSLKRLNERALPRVRSKAVYQALASRKE
jgi:uncharacterized protein (DUF169 family)